MKTVSGVYFNRITEDLPLIEVHCPEITTFTVNKSRFLWSLFFYYVYQERRDILDRRSVQKA